MASLDFIPPDQIAVKPEPPIGAGSFGIVFGATLLRPGRQPLEVREPLYSCVWSKSLYANTAAYVLSAIYPMNTTPVPPHMPCCRLL
jgi:hypothetical protein